MAWVNNSKIFTRRYAMHLRACDAFLSSELPVISITK